MKITSFIELTELWQDGEFNKVGLIINEEGWRPAKVAEFCAYVSKYVPRALPTLYKFLQ